MTKSKCQRDLDDMKKERDHWRETAKANGNYDAYMHGYEAGIENYELTMTRLNYDLHNYYMAMAYTMGIAAAGFGDTPRMMLKELSAILAETADKVISETRRVGQLRGREIDTLPFVTEGEEIKNALKAMYSGEDKNGDKLRQIATRLNPFIERNILIDRPALTPGRKKSDVIRRVCEMAKPLIAEGMTTDEILDALQVKFADDPAAGDELDYVTNADATSFNRAYQRHIMKS